MQIKTQSDKEFRELQVSGRLDAEWADTLQQAIEDALREGAHSLLLDLSEVVYISSAGLGVLVSAQKQFQSIRGTFGVKDTDGWRSDSTHRPFEDAALERSGPQRLHCRSAGSYSSHQSHGVREACGFHGLRS